MKRRVIKQGNNTLTITLPHKWAEKYGIKGGDELEVEEKKNKLVVLTQCSRFLSPREIDLSHFDLLIPRVIHALYKKGYDHLIFRYSNQNILPQIQNAMGNETIGYEIVKQGHNYCEVQNISEVLNHEFDPTLRRIFLILEMLANEGFYAIKKNDITQLKNTLKLEETNNRLTTFCRRTLTKYESEEFSDAHLLYLIIEELEKIADEYKYLYQFIIIKKGLALSKETIELSIQVNSILKDFHILFYDFQAHKAAELAKKRKQIVQNCYHLFETKNKDEIRVLHYLLNITQQVFNLLGPLIGFRL